MAYCIMRFEKHKAANIGSLAGSLAHTFRSRYTPNADPELIKDNRVWLGPDSTADTVRAIRERLPEKRRSDAVGCIEFFIGASPEWFEKHGGTGDQESYFQGAIDWLKAEFGEENVISVVQHNDETSPHLAAYVVPIDPVTGRLNAKNWTGGRQRCSALQTAFHAAAGEPVGLDRGRKGSTAEHMSIRRWYAGQADIDQRERAVRLEQWKRGAELTSRETDALFREHDVEDRERAAAEKDAQTAAERRSLSEAMDAVAEREKGLERVSEGLSKHAAELEERERRLASLERKLAALAQQLEARGDRLAGGEAALARRQAEIDRSGEKLQQRLLAARESQATWEARRDQWLAENRPADVPPEVEKLRALDDMTPSAAADFLAQAENDSMHEFFDALAGPTPAWRALLDQHADAAAAAEGWKDAGLEGQSDGPKI